MTNPQPGWYRDPSNSSQLRWWDGSQWTSYTQAANGATSGTSPAGRVTTSSSAYSAVPANPSASASGSAQAQYPSAQASSAQPQAPFAQTRPSSAPAQAPLAQPQAPFLASPKRATQRCQRGLPTPRQRRGHTDQAAHLASPAHPRPPWRLLAQRSPQSRRNPPHGRVSKSSSPSYMCF